MDGKRGVDGFDWVSVSFVATPPSPQTIDCINAQRPGLCTKLLRTKGKKEDLEAFFHAMFSLSLRLQEASKQDAQDLEAERQRSSRLVQLHAENDEHPQHS